MTDRQILVYDRTAVFVLPNGHAVAVDPNKTYTPKDLKRFADRNGDVQG